MSTAFGVAANLDKELRDEDHTDGAEDDSQNERPPMKPTEEDEDPLLKMRAKLFRYDTDSETKQWKERGTGEVKILIHQKSSKIRILMRRDKTMKICANHYLTAGLDLSANVASERSWVWKAPEDYSDGEAKHETLAIRFGTSEKAETFKQVFEQSQKWMELVMSKEKTEEELLKHDARPKPLEEEEEEVKNVEAVPTGSKEEDAKKEEKGTK